MSNEPEIHHVNRNLRIVVARTTEQSREIFESVAREHSVVRNSPGFASNAKKEIPKGKMLIFVLGEDNIELSDDPFDYDADARKFTFEYERVLTPNNILAALAVPYDDRKIVVDAHEIESPAMFEIMDLIGSGGVIAIDVGVDENGRLAVREARPQLSILDTLRSYALQQLQRRENTPYYNWSPSVIDELVDVSARLKQDYPNTTFMGIGNSPSYIIYALDYLSQKDGVSVHSGYIPFSARYVVPESVKNMQSLVYATFPFDVDYTVPTRAELTENYHAAKIHGPKYKKFLETAGMNPNSIIEKFETKGEKTAVIDNMQMGTSFATFVHFMYEWSRDLGVEKRFSKAFSCIALTDEPIPSKISLPFARLTVPVEIVPISRELRSALNGNRSLNTDRFVPCYPPKDWCNDAPESVEANAPMVDEVKAKIRAEVDGRFDNSRRPRLSIFSRLKRHEK